jgi:GNAT superfamily N-acetyltransferase
VLAKQIQEYVRSVVERDREPVPAGELVLYAHRSSTHPFLNYAIPASTATSDDGAALVRVARERGLVPRLEYVEECFPWVEESLTATGFVREARLRLMTRSPASLRPGGASDIELIRVSRGSPLVRPMLTVTHAAFDEPPPSDEDVARWDFRAIAAVGEAGVVGSAGWTTVIDGMSEIVGVAVAQNARRRGVGTALTIAAAAAAFDDGASLAFLTPGDDNTALVYERAGFTDTTTMIHLRQGAAGR